MTTSFYVPLLYSLYVHCVQINSRNNNATTTPPPFYSSLSGTTRESWCQKKIFLWTFMVQGRITEADTLTIRLGATPFGLISDPPPTSPIFMPDALPATTLPLYPGLGQSPNMLVCPGWHCRHEGIKRQLDNAASHGKQLLTIHFTCNSGVLPTVSKD